MNSWEQAKVTSPSTLEKIPQLLLFSLLQKIMPLRVLLLQRQIWQFVLVPMEICSQKQQSIEMSYVAAQPLWHFVTLAFYVNMTMTGQCYW